jgi:pimeloyl-ACP methyl ester carboxylesterase
MPTRPARPPQPPSATRPPEFETVDPRWILKALAGTICVAILCGYITVCALFWRGQWQLILQPARAVAQTPAVVNLAFTPVRFGVDSTGQPQLDGWWIPSDSPADPTVLMLHSGQGSMSDALPTARLLHDARLNVLLFDYRGFGRSGGQHPTQALMQADAASALRYLLDLRHIPASSLIVYGSGARATLAVNLCLAHTNIAGLILDAPDGDFTARVRQDPRSRMVPVNLLFHNDFALAAPLHTLHTPKLLITYTAGPAPASLEQAADPKLLVVLPTPTPAAIHNALRRFLDAYIPHPPPTLIPNP